MERNQGRLVSHYDLHQTLSGLCDPDHFNAAVQARWLSRQDGWTTHMNPIDLLRGEVPPNRTCEEAGIYNRHGQANAPCTCR